jgi:hypothetical protein
MTHFSTVMLCSFFTGGRMPAASGALEIRIAIYRVYDRSHDISRFVATQVPSSADIRSDAPLGVFRPHLSLAAWRSLHR